MKEKKSVIFSDVAADFIRDEETDAFTLMTIALHFFDKEVFTLKPPVLFNELEKTCSAKMPEENENKINAAITLITTDLYQNNLQVFKTITAALNDGDIDDVLNGEEDFDACVVMWGIYQAGLITGEQIKPSDFSEDVKQYLTKLFGSRFGSKEDAGTDTWIDSYVNLRVLGMCKDLYKLIGNKEHVISELLSSRGLKIDEIL